MGQNTKVTTDEAAPPITRILADFVSGHMSRGWDDNVEPFACGIVIHPAIDGCVQLRTTRGLRAEDVERIDLRVHPPVLELTGNAAPCIGLEGKFSVYHACAAAIIFGQAGEHEFSDRAVARADVIALRDRIKARADDGIGEDSVDISVTCRDGRTINLFVEHAIGSMERPLSDADLRAKFHGLVDPVLGVARAGKLIEQCASVATLGELRGLTALALG
jgi:2-methylcitrate dehydratase PrpD